MSPVAIVTCAGDAVDPDSPILLDALGEADVDAELVIWDDPTVAWERFDLVVLRSTWDYPSRIGEFLAWARSLPRLLNPYGVVAYSSDKHYLADLAGHGLATIPSRFCDVGQSPDFFDGDVVVKPCVGAGSMNAARFGTSQHDEARAHVAVLHASGRDALIQPYVASVDELGERAIIFIDGEFSHAMTKGAMLNVDELDRNALFRREQMSLASAEPEVVHFARRVLAAKGFSQLLYARVDLVQIDDEWAVMELELVEPSLFLTFDRDAPSRLAAAIQRHLR